MSTPNCLVYAGAHTKKLGVHANVKISLVCDSSPTPCHRHVAFSLSLVSFQSVLFCSSSWSFSIFTLASPSTSPTLSSTQLNHSSKHFNSTLSSLHLNPIISYQPHSSQFSLPSYFLFSSYSLQSSIFRSLQLHILSLLPGEIPRLDHSNFIMLTFLFSPLLLFCSSVLSLSALLYSISLAWYCWCSLFFISLFFVIFFFLIIVFSSVLASRSLSHFNHQSFMVKSLQPTRLECQEPTRDRNRERRQFNQHHQVTLLRLWRGCQAHPQVTDFFKQCWNPRSTQSLN